MTGERSGVIVAIFFVSQLVVQMAQSNDEMTLSLWLQAEKGWT